MSSPYHTEAFGPSPDTEYLAPPPVTGPRCDDCKDRPADPMWATTPEGKRLLCLGDIAKRRAAGQRITGVRRANYTPGA